MTLVGRLVAFCMFYVSIRVTLVDTSLLIRALYYDLIMLTFDISIMFHSVIHYAHPYDSFSFAFAYYFALHIYICSLSFLCSAAFLFHAAGNKRESGLE